MLNNLLHDWPTHVLEKHIANFQDAIKRGISDADSDARVYARKYVYKKNVFRAIP